jgi:cell division septation protein DedD
MAYALGPLRPDRQDRLFVRRRPRRGVTAIFVALVMLGSAGGIWALYRTTMRPPSGEVPLIRADDQPTRKRPSDPGGMAIPGQGTLVLDGKRADPKIEQLLPPPEAPLPRPAPPEPVAEVPATAAVAVAPPPAAPSSPPPPAVSGAAPAPSPPAAAAAQPPKPAPVVAAAPPQTPLAGKGFHLQLGAVRSAEGAKTEWEKLKRQNADLLGQLDFAAPRVDLGERGVFYRIQAGPLADATAAEHRCTELKRRGVGCILVRP